MSIQNLDFNKKKQFGLTRTRSTQIFPVSLNGFYEKLCIDRKTYRFSAGQVHRKEIAVGTDRFARFG